MKNVDIVSTDTPQRRAASLQSLMSRPSEDDTRVRLIVADPNEIYRIGVRSLLDSLDWVAVIGEAADEPGLTALLRTAGADLVLLDPRIARSNGDEAHVIERVRALAPDVRVVVVTDASREQIVTSIELGASGCVIRAADGEEVVAALQLVAQGRHYIQPDLIGPLLNRRPPNRQSAGLSAQQLGMLRLVSRGLKNRELASAFDVSLTTVKSQLRLIYAHLGVSSRAEAAAAAVRLEIVE
jgi:DNA-binding NarL/FixJ family response regulator